MDGDAHDDYFDDDDLDDVPDNDYNELERNAFLSTQKPSSLINPPVPVQIHGASNAGDYPTHLGSSDYGFEDEDEDIIDLDAQPAHRVLDASQSITRRSFQGPTPNIPRQPYSTKTPSASVANTGGFHNADNARLNAHTAANVSLRQPSNGGNQARHPQLQGKSSSATAQAKAVGEAQEPHLDVTMLKARIRELELERAGLQKHAEDARASAVSKTGEIAIVRANHDKASKEYERRLSVMQKLHAEEVAKQKAELDAARKEREKVETNNKFLEHDLAQEAEKARNARRSLKEGQGNVAKLQLGKPGSPMSTPKKNKSLPFRDGFDDDEVMFVSPSKSKEKSKTSTPKAGAKRKRNAIEQSPAQPLPLTEPEGLTIDHDAKSDSTSSASMFAPMDPHQEKMQFMRSVLNHRKSADNERTMEVMTTHSFPSDQKKTMSSLLYDKFNVLWSENSLEECRMQFCQELMSLWSRCLEEKFHAPLYDLMELLQYILVVSPSGLSTSCIPRLVPLCLATADIIAVPTAKASKSPSTFEPPPSELKAQIDPLDYLGMLDLCVLGCATRTEPLTIFWKTMEYDFVLVMLHKAQPMSQITSMLSLLTTSTLPSSFGAIAMSSPQQQHKHESDTIDRLTVLLFETPEPPSNEDPYGPTELLQLRIDILVLFKAMCATLYGGKLLATHRLAIGRLVRLLHESVVALYAYIPVTHALTTQIVNTSIYILAHLTACHADVVDMRARLAAVPGGAHKHLVALSRVAFADGIGVIEQGIDGEAAEAAHRMLDEWLSPEEGEAVVSVFSSAR